MKKIRRYTPILATGLFLSVLSTHAQLTWDPDNNQTSDGGAGTWDAATLNWDDDGSAPNVGWDVSGTTEAIFGDAGANYVVDIADGGVSVSTLTVEPGTGKVSLRSVTDNLGVLAISGAGATWDTGGRELELVNDQANDTSVSIAGGATLAIIGDGEFDTGEKPNGANWSVPAATLDIQSATFVRGNVGSVGQFATVKMADGSTFSAERNVDQTYNNNWELGASATDTTNFSRRWNERTATYAGIVSGLGGMTIGTQGSGYSSFTGVNTFTGKVVINGRMQVNSDDALGAAPVSPVADQVTIDGGLLRAASNTNVDANRGITVGAGGATLSSDATFNIDSVISGSSGGDVTFIGSGLTDLRGVTNTYDGRTIVDGGELWVGSDDNLGAVPGAPDADNIILKNGGQLYSAAVTYNSNRGVTLENGGTFLLTSGPSTFGGPITGTGGLQLGRDQFLANYFILTSDTSDYTGGTRIRKGRLQLGIDEAIPADTVVTIGGTNGGPSRFLLDGFSQTIGGLDIAGDNERVVYNGESTGAPDLGNTGSLTIDVADGESYIFGQTFGSNAAQERGNFNLVKNGLGSQQLSNVFIGGTVDVNAGTLLIGNNAGGANTGAVTITGGLFQIADDLTASSITHTGGTLSIGNGGTGGSIVGDPALAIGGTLVFNRSNAFTYSGDLSGAGGIQVDGGGTITLTGTNTFDGAAEVIDGTLIAGNATALPDYSLVQVAADEIFMVPFDGVAWTSSDIAGGGGLSTTVDWLDPSAYLGLDISAGAIALGDGASGSHGLWVQGGNVLTLSTAQTYTGPTRIAQGTIELTGTDQLPTATVFTVGGIGNSFFELNGFDQTLGGLVSNGGSTKEIDNNGGTVSTLTFDVGAGEEYAWNANMRETGAAINIVKTGDGTQGIDKDNPTSYTGTATVNAGTLGFRFPNAIDPATQAITVASGATFRVDAGGGSEWLMAGIDSLLTDASFAAGSSLGVRTQDDAFDYTSNITGDIGLTKSGNNPMTLSGTNDYTGKTVALGSYLVIDDETDIGANPGAFAADHLTLDGGGLRAAAALTIDDANRGITLLDGGGLIDYNLLEMTVAAPITGSGSLAVTGTSGHSLGFVELTGANTYTGETVVSQGSLKVSSSSNFPDASNLRLNGVGLLLIAGDFDGGNAADFTRPLGEGAGEVQFTNGGGFGASGADRSVDLGGAGADLTWGVDGFMPEATPSAFTFFLSAPEATHTTTLVNGMVLPGTANYGVATYDSAAEIDAVMSGNISGTGGFRARFSGTLVLEGTNTYEGVTNLEDDGILLVNGDQSGATGAVTVTADATLGGTGTIGGAITIDDGGVLAPGASVGTLTATNGVTFSNNSTFAVEIDSSVPSADKLVVSGGAISIGTGVSLDVLDIAAVPAIITAGTKLTIVDYTGATLPDTFDGLADGATITVGSQDFILDYDDGGDFVTLTAQAASAPFDTWAASNGLTGGNEGPTDDPDGDGENLYEYFFWDSDPLTADVFGSELTGLDGSGALSGTLVFSHDRPKDISDVTVTYQWTTDLTAGWTDDGASDGTNTVTFATGTLGVPANGNSTDYESVEVTATVTVGTPTQIFVRVSVTQP
ncbi:MAG: beta strand repeat-containing protein [Opitutaceae bacterium]